MSVEKLMCYMVIVFSMKNQRFSIELHFLWKSIEKQRTFNESLLFPAIILHQSFSENFEDF